MESVEIYKKVLSGELKIFPMMFFHGEEGYKRALEVSRYVVEEVNGLNADTVKDGIRYNMFAKCGLGRMLRIAFDDKIYNVIQGLYPEKKYLPWEVHYTPMNFWTEKENRLQAINWLIEKKGWKTAEDVSLNLGAKILKEEGFSGMLDYYNSSVYAIVSDLLEFDIPPWKMKKVRKNYWTSRENRLNAMKWLINKYGWTEEEFPSEIGYTVMEENGLKGMLLTRYNGRVYDCVIDLFPNKYKAEDFKKLHISREKEDVFEEQERKINTNKELYYKDNTQINEKIKDKIISSATKGKNYCEIEFVDIEEDIEILVEQGFKVEEIEGKYLIKW